MEGGGIPFPGGHAVMMLIISTLAIAGGSALGDFAYHSLRRKRVALAINDTGNRERLACLAKRGVAPLEPLSTWLLRRSRLLRESFSSVQILIAEFGIDASMSALLSDLLLVSILTFAVGFVIGRSAVLGIALAVIVFIGAISFARNRFAKQNIMMREEIPEALRTIAMSFRSGHSLPQVLSDASRECKGYLAHLFSIAADRIEMGATPNEALSVMRGNPRAPELSFVAVALDIQHQCGGGVALVLESAMDSIEGELKLARSLRVQTAQAKLSASIVTIMPFILVALFSLFSPDFLSPFFTSLLGMTVLAIALIMQMTGILIVRRMLNVDGE